MRLALPDSDDSMTALIKAAGRIAVALAALGAAAASLAQQPVIVRPVTAPFQPPEVVEPTNPQPVNRLTLAELEQIALANNPSLARSAALVSAARGNWVQVGLPPNPSWGYLGQQLGSGPAATQHALMIDGELITGAKLAWNRAVAEQEVVRTEQEMYAQQQRVLTDVRVAFYEALLAQRSLELAEQLLRIAQGAASAAERLHGIGEKSRIDLRQAEIEVFTAENNQNDARTKHFAAWQSLRAVLGTPWLANSRLEGDLETLPQDVSWDEALARLQATSPEIATAAANVERARAALVRARREPVPNLRYQLAVMQDMGIGGKTDGIVQALLPLPLINRNQGGISQATAELAAAELAVEQVQLDLQNRLAVVYQRYASAAYRVRRFRESILPAARDQLELVQRRYSAGEVAFLSLLNAQRTYFQTHQQYLQSILELRTSVAEMEGSLLRGGLAVRP
jgi:cobalt-zinc-cadmium efflux system outer membrane protein